MRGKGAGAAMLTCANEIEKTEPGGGMTIFYGGIKEKVKQQLICQHDWHGPCVDRISRYFKCKICFAIDRDCAENEYYQKIAEKVTCDEAGNPTSIPVNLNAIWPLWSCE